MLKNCAVSGKTDPMLSKDLDGRRGVVIDTMVFIYLFEDHPAFGDICENLFNQINAITGALVHNVHSLGISVS